MIISLFHLSLGGGGVERMGINLAQGFLTSGAKVDMVLANLIGPYISQLPSEVRLIDLGAKSLPRDIPKVIFNLTQYLKKVKPTFLISSSDHYNFLPLMARRIAGTKTRIAVSFHTTLSQRSKNTPTIKAKLIPFVVRHFLPCADVIVAVSQGVAEDLASITGIPKSRIRVIYNPVVTSELLQRSHEHVKHAWFAPGEPPVILGVGRLTKAKDFPTLIRAFALVRQERPARLMILGEGEERFRLEALVKELGLEDDVALPGFVDNPYAYMARAAVFVLSSAWEGLPTVLIEAMACGCPVVSTDCPSGPAEILENGKYGPLVPVGDADKLAEAIRIVFDKPLESDVLCRRANLFSLEKICEEDLALLLRRNCAYEKEDANRV
ncbi:MAG: glycosyltransferase [Firmicutes bacterium]|nr:glycosyltransferase [Bacillota bacterium]